MNVIEKLFGRAINNAASTKINQAFVAQYAREVSQMVNYLGGTLPTLSEDGFDYDNNAFRKIGAVYECTDLISKKVINSPFIFYKIKDKKKLQLSKSLEKTDPVQSYLLKLQAVEEVDNQYLSKLLDNPNPYQTGKQFIWTTALVYLLRGNSFVYGNRGDKMVKQMWCIPDMQILVDDAMTNKSMLDPIMGFRMPLSNGAPMYDFGKDEIYHLKTGNPSQIDITYQYLYGVSPLRAYLEQMRTIKEAQTQASKQSKNGGVFGILSPKDKEDQFGSDQKKQLHEKMKEARMSGDELARVFPSSITLQWQNIGLPIADLQLLELIGANEEAIYRAYHVPLTFHNQKSSTDNNVGTETKKMVYDAVLPICEAISELLTNFVAPGYGVDMIELDYTQLPEMAVNMKEVADYIIPLVEKGIISPDEGRVALKYGETNLDFMQEYYIGSAQTTRRRVFDGSNTPPPISTTTT